MTYQNLFRIILKVIGIFFIKDMLAMLPQLFSAAHFFYTDNSGDSTIFIYSVFPIIVFIVYCTMAYYLIINSDLLIKKLGLVNDFEEEEIKNNLHRSTILSIVILMVSVFIIVDSTPIFVSNILTYLRDNELSYGGTGGII